MYASWPHWNSIFLIFYMVFWHSGAENHIKSKDFWSNLQNWIIFIFFGGKNGKLFWSFLVVFRSYLIFLAPEYQYSYSKDQICFNEKLWEPVSRLYKLNLFIFIFPNARPEFRTSDLNFVLTATLKNILRSYLNHIDITYEERADGRYVRCCSEMFV